MQMLTWFSRTLIATSSLLSCSLFGHIDMRAGIAFVTTVQGDVTLNSADKAGHDIGLHETRTIDDQSIRTGKDSHVFLALSNGVGLAVNESSEVEIATYKQSAFRAEKESNQFEPSTSILEIDLHKGSIALASKHLSPLSKMQVRTPTGKLNIQSAGCVVTIDETGTHIIAVEGSMTFYYPNEKGREFIIAPRHVRVSETNAQLGRMSDEASGTDIDSHAQKIVGATQSARSRVIFRATKPDHAPQAILVAPIDYELLPLARPYQFKK